MMKHMQFLSLICAAGVVLASVPALPVIAAENAPVSTASEQREISEDGYPMLNGTTEDGFWWEVFNADNAGTVAQTAGKFGSFQFSWKDVKNAYFESIPPRSQNTATKEAIEASEYRYAGKMDLGDSGYYGCFLRTVPMLYFYIIEGWAENCDLVKNAGEKLGTITESGREYDVYCRQEPTDDPNETYITYSIIAHNNQYQQNQGKLVKGIVPVGKLVKQLVPLGMDESFISPASFHEPVMIVGSGSNPSGKASGSAELLYSWFNDSWEDFGYSLLTGDPFSDANGDYYWQELTAFELGTTEHSADQNGSFSYSWKDAEEANFVYGISDRLLRSEQQMLLGKSFQYEGEADLGSTGYYGISCSVAGRDLTIIEGWGENSNVYTKAGEKVGELTANGVQYDVYEYRRLSSMGTTVSDVCIRQDNQYEFAGSGTKRSLRGYIPVGEIIEKMNAYREAGDTCYALNMLVSSGWSETGMVSGSASFKNVALTESGTWFTKTGKTDGYDWAHIQKAQEYNTAMTIGNQGTFKAEWDDLIQRVSALFVSGKKFNNVSLDEVQSISCAYEVKRECKHNAAPDFWNYGFVSTFADLSGEEPVLTEYYLTDAAPSVRIGYDDNELQIAVFQIGDIFYSVYRLPVTEETQNLLPVTPQHFTKTQYWIERYWDFHDGNITVSDSFSDDLLPIFKELEKNGLKPEGTLTDISFYAQTGSGTGNLEVLKNEIDLVKTGAIDPEPNVRGDANGDGVLDVSDAVLASRILVEDADAKISDQGLLNADIDRSGKLDTADITMMLQVIAKKIVL